MTKYNLYMHFPDNSAFALKNEKLIIINKNNKDKRFKFNSNKETNLIWYLTFLYSANVKNTSNEAENILISTG